MRTAFIALLVMLALCAPTTATDFYVSTKGKGAGSPVWVHCMAVDDAIKAAKQYGGRGCDAKLIK